MPKITVENEKTFDAPAGKKLVLAIEDAGIDILHRCGGNARCTTCRVEVIEGTVPPISTAEIEALEDPDLIEKYRLSCQRDELQRRVSKRASDLTIKSIG
jgi:ferredoxin